MTESGERRSTPSQGADVGRALGIVIDALVVSPLESGISAVRDPAAASDRARQELRNARMIGSMITNGGMAAFTASTGLRPPSRPTARVSPARDEAPSSEAPSSEATSTPPSRRPADSRATSAQASSTADRDATEVLDAEVLAVAERVAKVPADLQALNKRVVHRAMEAMGMRNGMRATADINAIGFHQPSSIEYHRRFAEGVTTALSARDETFGDYRTGSGDDG